jgi:hypothetical protein
MFGIQSRGLGQEYMEGESKTGYFFQNSAVKEADGETLATDRAGGRKQCTSEKTVCLTGSSGVEWRECKRFHVQVELRTAGSRNWGAAAGSPLRHWVRNVIRHSIPRPPDLQPQTARRHQ